MAKASFAIQHFRIDRTFGAGLIELLRPYSVRRSQEYLASASTDFGADGFREWAQRVVDVGGETSWIDWLITDALGIERDGNAIVSGGVTDAEVVNGVPVSGFNLGALDTATHWRLKIGIAGPLIFVPSVRVASLPGRTIFEIDARDDEIEELRNQVAELASAHVVAPPRPDPPAFKVFIGHGSDPQWKYLQRALNDTHGFLVEAFESSERAGYHTLVVVDKMVRSSAVAVVVMTGEDSMGDGSLRARENVVHEIGFCQGVLGLENTIIVMEEGISEPSNIAGLTQIRFPRGGLIDIEARIVEALQQRRTAHDYEQAV